MWYAPKSSVNEDRLCHSDTLQRDPWPWISQYKEEWSLCPFTGGFDFRSHVNGEERNLCHRQWRPARIESECIDGEGIQFSFPQKRCNIFRSRANDLGYQMYCWGSWEENDYRFLVMGDDSILPQYILRLPRDMESAGEIEAMLYFSPVAPLWDEGKPPEGIHYVQMKMVRSDFAESSDIGTCFDESEKCADFAREGKCVNYALHEYASYCKKSCGLCGGLADFAPSATVECRFPTDYQGDWLFYDRTRSEQVKISEGQVSFSKLGNFICKGKHWERNLYKMFSVYHNGCRPRYSCLNFRRDGNILLYRLSRSTLSDNSFDMCEFYDDPEPLGASVRSEELKVLLPVEHTEMNSCGIGGLLHINSTFQDGISCSGTLTDWDELTCQPMPFMSLKMHSCAKGYFRDFQCEAHVVLGDGSSVLISTSTDEQQKKVYECWLIKTYVEGMAYRPWSRAFLVASGQCGTERDFTTARFDTSIISVQSFSDRVDRGCRESDRPGSWKPVAEEPLEYPYGKQVDDYTPRTNTLPMFLHDIITKAVRPPATTTTPKSKSSTLDEDLDGRLPRKEDPQHNKSSQPQEVVSGTIRSFQSNEALSVRVTVIALLSICWIIGS